MLEKLLGIFKDKVKVILHPKIVIETSSDIIEILLKSPLKIADFKPYNREEIYNRNLM